MTSEFRIGPELGVVARPPGRHAWEEVRLALLDTLLAAQAEGDLAQPRWQGALDAAARSLRLRLLAGGEAELTRAAQVSRFPPRRLRHLLPDAEAAERLLNRLLSAGIPLEACESLPDTVEARRRRAQAIEASWVDLSRMADQEAAAWHAKALMVASWRRPMWPVWVAGGMLLLCATIAAAWLGGQLPSPAWFAPVRDAWWRLPWP